MLRPGAVTALVQGGGSPSPVGRDGASVPAPQDRPAVCTRRARNEAVQAVFPPGSVVTESACVALHGDPRPSLCLHANG